MTMRRSQRLFDGQLGNIAGTHVCGRAPQPLSQQLAGSGQILQTQGYLDFAVVVTELAKPHGEIKHHDIQHPGQQGVDGVKKAVERTNGDDGRQDRQTPGGDAMQVSTCIETGLDEIRPRPERSNDHPPVIKGMQLLDEKNCNQREKAHGEGRE